MSDNLILDITNPQQQLISQSGQQIGFYDGFKADKPVLYIYVKNNEDRFTVVRRRACSKKISDGLGGYRMIPETEIYARAYKKYLDLKQNGGVYDREKEILRARIKELEASSKHKPTKEVLDSNKKLPITKEVDIEHEEPKKASEIKEELDLLGIEYKGNASKEVLLQLLNDNT